MAKRHTFRLETLLRLRRQREDEQKRVVASRMRRIRSLENNKQTLEVRIADQVEVMRGLLSEPLMNVDQMKSGRHWMVRLRRGVLEADAAISAERAMLAQERRGLAEKRKDTKILDRLKERQREVYLSELARLDQAEMDELNTTRFAHARFNRGTEEL